MTASATERPYDSLDALRGALGQKAKVGGSDDPAWRAKMLHPLPKATVVNRAEFLLERVKDKRVMEFGSSGAMSAAIRKAASAYTGVDREPGDAIVGCDLDDYGLSLPEVWPEPDVVICGELLEHLSNPGHFLTRLRAQFRCQTIVTVPNAYSIAGRQWLAKGYDCVNRDHVAWHSPKTLSVLLERAGYEIREFYYYHAAPIEPAYHAEGLIAVAE